MARHSTYERSYHVNTHTQSWRVYCTCNKSKAAVDENISVFYLEKERAIVDERVKGWTGLQ